MHPSSATTNSEMITSSPFVLAHSNPNLASSNANQSPSLSSNNHYSYPDLASPSASASSLNYMDLLRAWNYHQFLTPTLNTDQSSDNSPSDYHPRNGSFHHYYPRLLQKPSCQQTDDEIFLTKFHHDTLVKLDTGESKNIQQLTTNDFLTSAKRSNQYSRLNKFFLNIIFLIISYIFSLLARVEYIGSIDKSTGKAELRFHIDDIDKTVIYFLYKIHFQYISIV